MTDVLKHRFTSPKLDGSDTQQIQPSHWNDGHKFQGGNAGDVLTRDSTDASFGAKWAVVAPWVDVPFSAANFYASNGAWAMGSHNQTHLAYSVSQSTVMLLFNIGGSPTSTLSGPAVFLYINIPGIPTPSRMGSMPFSYFLPGGAGVGNVSIATTSPTRFDLIRDIGGTPWPAIGAGGFLYLQGLLIYPRA